MTLATEAATQNNAGPAKTALDAFAAAWPDASETLAPASEAGDAFSYRFVRTLNEMVMQRRPDEKFMAMVRRMSAVIVRKPEAAVSCAFWDALVVHARNASAARLERGQIRSVWGVTPIHSIADMARIDRRLGVRAETLVFTTYHTADRFDVNLTEHERQIFALDGGGAHESFRWIVFAWALLRYDVFHWYNDRGIVEPAGGYGAGSFGIAPAELDLLSAAGKRLFAYAYGADHRTRLKTLAGDRFNFCMDCPEPGTFCICSDEAGERMQAAIRAHATRMVATGLAMDAIPGALNLHYLPIDIDAIRPRPTPRNRGPLRIGHFPNHGYFKGTSYLVQAVESLRADGVAIELDMISGIPREQVLERMARADVIVDQLISGAFGLTALEAMAMARPVICHLREGVQLADLARCPIVRANPDTICAVLGDLARTPAALPRIGASSRAYVVRNYSLERLAGRLAEFYAANASFPAEHASALQRRGQAETRRLRRRRFLAGEWLMARASTKALHAFGSTLRDAGADSR